MGNSDKIAEIMKKNSIFGEVYDIDKNTVGVEISWGDWKHEHLRLRNIILGSELKIVNYEEIVTEENGTDSYSAIHKFSF